MAEISSSLTALAKIVPSSVPLLPGAPSSVRRHYRQRITANATGECPRCGSIAADPLEGAQASISHNDGCPVLLVNIEPGWILALELVCGVCIKLMLLEEFFSSLF